MKTRKFNLRSPSERQSYRPEPSLLPLIGWEAEPFEIDETVVFTLIFGIWDFDVVNAEEKLLEKRHKYALSLPAAAQLARDLDACVQEYLYGDEAETRSRTT